MRSPFPGMDPYLERHWLDVHHGMTTYCRDQMQGKLPGSLRARIEERVFVETEEAFVQIIDLAAGGRVVTVIEFVSPTKKTRGEGRDLYLRKRAECFAAGVNYVEVDLTRLGDRHADFLPFSLPVDDREAYIAWARLAVPPRRYEIYPLSLRARLPAIRIPLRETDADVVLELQPLVDQCYRNGAFDDIDYREEPPARFTSDEAIWADPLLRAAGVR